MKLYNKAGTLVIHDPDGWYDYNALCEEWKDKMGELENFPDPTEQELNTIKVSEANAYLASTDWYATRLAETGKEIPDDVKEKRADSRETISKLRTTNA